jgi:hypothetical protein
VPLEIVILIAISGTKVPGILPIESFPAEFREFYRTKSHEIIP